MVSLSDLLDEDLLIDYAGETYFERGEAYFDSGRVRSLAQYGDRITADVIGTETYQVQIWLDDDNLNYRCTCPLGIDDIFCKHCVAVGLAWIDEPPPYRATAGAPSPQGITLKDVRDYLNRQDRDTLVQMILTRAMEDTTWRDALLLKTALHQDEGADITTIRRSLRNAIATGDNVDYYSAHSYAEGVQMAVDAIEDLLDEGYADDVVELCEEAMDALEKALNDIDDSDGYMTPIMEQIEDLHYRACEASQPDPISLAERLFQRELTSGFGFFHGALTTYAPILGKTGLQAYHQLVDQEWNKLPALTPGDRRSFDFRRSQLSRMKEALVAKTGNIEDQVSVITRDLSTPNRYLTIAQLYHHDGQLGRALNWAEQGLSAFSEGYQSYHLRAFLVDVYQRQGRFDDAMQLVWEEFIQSPSLPGYQRLKTEAEKGDRWPAWCNQALDHLRTQATNLTAQPQGRRSGNLVSSVLVDVLLWEGDIDQAWQAAQAHGCLPKQRFQLAALREASHPEDALAIYQPEIELLIEQTTNDAYRQAVDLLNKVHILMLKLGREQEFQAFLNYLTTTYKRKRNFITFLNQKRWSSEHPI